MKIVIDARDALLERVGVAVYAKNVIQRLIEINKDEADLIIIGPESSDCPFILNSRASYLAVAPKSTSGLYKKIKWYYQLPSILKKIGADLYFGNVAKLPFRENISCPLVVTAHDAASISTENLVDGKIKKLIKFFFVKGWVLEAAHIICISNYCQKEFSDIFGAVFEGKSTVIYHGLPEDFKNISDSLSLDVNAVKLKYGITGKFLISVGTVSSKKNYERLLLAFDRLNRDDLSLIIVGGFSYNSQEIIESRLGLKSSDRIHFIGSAPTVDVCTLMKSAECFVFPSLYEGFGIPLLESFYLSLPVACSNATCLPEIAGDAAIYFDPYNVDDIKEKINHLLNNNQLKQAISSLGLERVKQFNWDESARRHFSLLKKIILNSKL